MLIIAHRGYCRELPENSMAAFEEAVVVGCHRIELDVRLSADDELWIIHDDDLKRTVSRVCGLVSKLSTAALLKARLSNGEPIPRLQEVLERFLDRIELNIEIKGSDPKLTRKAAKLVRSSPHRDRVIFSSFDPAPLKILQQEFPELQRAVLWGLETIRMGEPAYIAPQLYMEDCGAQIIHPQVELVDQNFMEQAKRHRWRVFPWAGMKSVEDQNRRKIWGELIERGVDGLCTNYAAELSQFLKEGNFAHSSPS